MLFTGLTKSDAREGWMASDNQRDTCYQNAFKDDDERGIHEIDFLLKQKTLSCTQIIAIWILKTFYLKQSFAQPAGAVEYTDCFSAEG